MTARIPDDFMDLIRKPAFAQLATLMKDGSPQVTPVWFDYDGEYIRINSARGRIKDLNMRRRPQVALCIVDPQNPYRYLAVRGTVAEIAEAGANGHIDQLAKKYLNLERYPNRAPGEVRVMYKVLPARVSTMG
jgi:PPOX class probable F420-dependent enzyme